MIVALKRRDPCRVERAFLAVLNPFQERKAFLKRLVLQIARVCDERVTDGRRLREQGRDPRPRILTAATAGHFGNRLR